MKLKLIMLFLLIVSMASSAEKVKSINKWIPVLGYTHSTTKLFYDVNSMNRSATNIGSISILMTSNKPMHIVVDNRTLVTRSIVKHLAMDCNSGLMAPASNYYYSVAMPTSTDKPFAVYTYNNMSGAETVKKSSLMYGLVCPTPI